GSNAMLMTGNIIYRSGASCAACPEDQAPFKNVNALFEETGNITFTSNTLGSYRDDGDSGFLSPDYGIVLRKLRNSMIKDNMGNEAGVKTALLDLGEHDGKVQADNGMMMSRMESGR
ncbi:MAG: hypothetical protein FWF44_09180, partial [Defluviitaleaceae bacterium]|nr:hypothetical protein [Defluviitaleaceae bacterium]